MSSNDWINAFAPIRIISAGGFLAVTYLKNRQSTGDIDYLIDPEFAEDKDIKGPLQTAINAVAHQLKYEDKWINEDMAIFVTKKTRQTLFKQAEKQGIMLFKGKSLEILAAPLEWALERKIRRIYAAERGRKIENDLTDAVALLRELRARNRGPLDGKYIQRLNMNGFDVLPDHETMQRVAREYRLKYNEDIFK
jgi:hypothetical protein